ASRRALGTAVFGGMLAATFLAIFFVPIFFVIVQGFIERGRPSPPFASDSATDLDGMVAES
ncbi:efflux RND transporter permease subunit, partial [Singulisphaera rosea]